MKNLVSVLISLLITIVANAQPVAAPMSNIVIDSVMTVKYNAVRVAFDAKTNALYYITFNGDLYKIIDKPGVPLYDTLMAGFANHGINYLQGIAIGDSTIYLVGNHKIPQSQGFGVVAKGKLSANGGRTWTELARTVAYPSSATLYDHAFAGTCLTPNGDTLIVASGARTDHGEVQSTGGLYPNTREVPLTTKIFQLPTAAQNLLLQNREGFLDSAGYVFARGVRNEFDIAYDANGQLFGVENCGDRDDPEEMNWLRKGKHYGFPWEMGGNQTPQQFPNYVPTDDKMINYNCLGWGNGGFANDPNYPQKPANLVTTQPIKNLGPDADKFRDPTTGNVLDASDLGVPITTFTSHRSPLGLVFDNAQKLAAPYTSDAFTLSYTIGTLDSSGTMMNNAIGPFVDLSQDLLHLHLSYDAAADNYTVTTKKIVTNFNTPVDAELVNNKMYVIETNSTGSPKLWKLTFPLNTAQSNDLRTQKLSLYPNPAQTSITIMGAAGKNIEIMNALAQKMPVSTATQTQNAAIIDVSNLKKGVYVVKIGNQVAKFIKD